jgi:NAD(P)-dependent dehydrogenase (short-subunit alcohol dehydrogenase family)
VGACGGEPEIGDAEPGGDRCEHQPLAVQRRSPEMKEQLRSTTPLGRLGEPEEMADVIVFLLSEESSYMTGSTVIASGGRILIP